MTFQLPALPYPQDALAPHISAETLDFHHGKHHKAYVDKLNTLVPGTDYEGKSLEEVIKAAPAGPVFNNAAQIWNHTFLWNSLSPTGGGAPTGKVGEAILKAFGSFEKFKEDFTNSAINNFGSSWTWLVKKADGTVAIVNTSNAGTPLTDASVVPLITIDLWEHAYYIDYRNARPKYIEAYWSLVNWEFANKNFG